jgi:hypothetical protein
MTAIASLSAMTKYTLYENATDQGPSCGALIGCKPLWTGGDRIQRSAELCEELVAQADSLVLVPTDGLA